jgi:hypothetical protein
MDGAIISHKEAQEPQEFSFEALSLRERAGAAKREPDRAKPQDAKRKRDSAQPIKKGAG